MQRASHLAARYFVPAETLLHQRTLMAWPSAPLLHPKELSAARSEVAAIANAISSFEPVTMFASPGTEKDLRRRLNANVSISALPVDDLWIRDSGPVFALSASGDVHGIDFNFNYWGGKFPQGVDVDLARRILALADIPRVQAQVRAEGGGLEVDGEGTLLATESCLINPNRNPGLSKDEVEDRLKTALGVEKVIWFKGVRNADSTDCHVDALARFISPGRVILSKPNPAQPGIWTDVYEDAKSVLQCARDSNGRSFHVVELLEPNMDLLELEEDEDMVASYANFYLPNGAVIIPRFGDQVADERCAKIFRELFPDREIVQVFINMLPRLGGGIHCATQQQPRSNAT